MSKLFAAFAALALVAVAAPAMAQSSASTTGTGSITVIRPLTITKNADLQFGTVVRPQTGTGSVEISAAGVREVTGGVVALTSGDAPQAAQFTVQGEGGQSISVTIPATFTMASGGSERLTVTTSNNLNGTAGSQTLSNSMGTAGSLSFRVGGTVPVGSSTVSGAYTGSFTVSAAYN